MEHLVQLGVGGIFALLIIKEVFAFIKAKKPTHVPAQTLANNIQKNLKSIQSDNCSKEHVRMEKMIENISRQVADMYKWHDVEDSEGVKVWYVRKSLEEAIGKLSSSIEKQTELLRVFADEFRSSRKDFQYLTKEVHDMKKMKKV